MEIPCNCYLDFSLLASFKKLPSLLWKSHVIALISHIFPLIIYVWCSFWETIDDILKHLWRWICSFWASISAPRLIRYLNIYHQPPWLSDYLFFYSIHSNIINEWGLWRGRLNRIATFIGPLRNWNLLHAMGVGRTLIKVTNTTELSTKIFFEHWPSHCSSQPLPFSFGSLQLFAFSFCNLINR